MAVFAGGVGSADDAASTLFAILTKGPAGMIGGVTGGGGGACVEAADRIAAVVAVGVNCTDPRFVAALLATARGRTQKPLLVYPNRGTAYDATEKRWVDS